VTDLEADRSRIASMTDEQRSELAKVLRSQESQDFADFNAAVAATGREHPSRFQVMMQLATREGESAKEFIDRVVRVLALHPERALELPGDGA
jgi:hypothetical protein